MRWWTVGGCWTRDVTASLVRLLSQSLGTAVRGGCKLLCDMSFDSV